MVCRETNKSVARIGLALVVPTVITFEDSKEKKKKLAKSEWIRILHASEMKLKEIALIFLSEKSFNRTDENPLFKLLQFFGKDKLYCVTKNVTPTQTVHLKTKYF